MSLEFPSHSMRSYSLPSSQTRTRTLFLLSLHYDLCRPLFHKSSRVLGDENHSCCRWLSEPNGNILCAFGQDLRAGDAQVHTFNLSKSPNFDFFLGESLQFSASRIIQRPKQTIVIIPCTLTRSALEGLFLHRHRVSRTTKERRMQAKESWPYPRLRESSLIQARRLYCHSTFSNYSTVQTSAVLVVPITCSTTTSCSIPLTFVV